MWLGPIKPSILNYLCSEINMMMQLLWDKKFKCKWNLGHWSFFWVVNWFATVAAAAQTGFEICFCRISIQTNPGLETASAPIFFSKNDFNVLLISETRWLDHMFNIWLFTAIKIRPKAFKICPIRLKGEVSIFPKT